MESPANPGRFRFPFQSQSVRIMYKSVEDGIGKGVIADGGVPLVYRQLAGHECRGGTTPRSLAARKMKPGFLVGRLDENVRIEDQYLLFFHRLVKLGAVGYIDPALHHFAMKAVAAGYPAHRPWENAQRE